MQEVRYFYVRTYLSTGLAEEASIEADTRANTAQRTIYKERKCTPRLWVEESNKSVGMQQARYML